MALIDLYHHRTTVIRATRIVRGFDEPEGLQGRRLPRSQDSLNPSVAHRPPHAIRAEQERVTQPEIDGEGINHQNSVTPQASVDLVAQGVSKSLLGGNRLHGEQLRNPRVV